MHRPPVMQAGLGVTEAVRAGVTGLSGSTLLAYADIEIGAREVEDLPGRIAYGVYS